MAQDAGTDGKKECPCIPCLRSTRAHSAAALSKGFECPGILERGPVAGLPKWIEPLAALAVAFARLFLMPTKPNALPQQVRLAPAW